AISAVSVRRSKAQLRSKWPRTETATPLAYSTPSTSAPSSSAGGVTLEARIARRQARLCGFVTSPSPSPQALEDEDDDDGFGDDDD
ncbi:hypothetical protein SO802_029863, partial [Lithocarpus litseifolius]